MGKIAITSYQNPDIDGVSCSFAYSELLNQLGKDTVGMVSGSPYIEAQWVLDYLDLVLPVFEVQNDQPVILVDTSDPSMIPYDIKPEQVIEIVDHRKANNADLFPNAKVQIELVGAAATLIAEKFKENNLVPSKTSATLLYAGIASNTLNFKAKVTTDRDIKMAKWLLDIAKLSDDFIHQMFASKSDFSDITMKAAIRAELSKVFNVNGRAFAIGQLEMVGVEELYSERLDEIISALKEIKEEMHAEYAFLSGIDLEGNFNAFVYTDQIEKELLIEVLNAKENGKYLKRSGVILRKEIMPILLDHFK